ncbi:MAG: capsular polysaccharide synthesis protein [Lachnospiraceae bacterium]|nr:capsular polysaccharide synthesis protein [Lachnospiraceae bacterium]
MDQESGKIITELLTQAQQLIDADKSDDAYKLISSVVSAHPEAVDGRFQAELQLIMKNMEYKKALKEFSFLRSMSLVYKYCEVNYQDAGRELDGYEAGTELPEKDVIWCCWLQGAENAPEVVKTCMKSLGKLGRKIVILDEGNIGEYVKLPGHIEEKYKSGIISRTHYTDLVRLELLTERGGAWIDATTFISGTDMIKSVLETDDLFMYRSGNVSEYIVFDSWFIQAKRKSSILEAAKRMLYAYWEKEGELKNYFLVHLLLTLACRIYPEEYSRIALFSNEPAHVLQHDMFLHFSEKRWGQILKMSDVHKLTYKYEERDISGTFLEYVMKQV